MLKDNYEIVLTPFDRVIFEQFVPQDHYLRKLGELINFEAFRPLVADCYSSDLGRGAHDPVRLIKYLILKAHHGLSDEAVIRQTQVNLAFRFFLGLSADSVLPEPSLLCQFRQRLGEQRMRKIFQEIVRQARELGLVKDRLRLKDATHVIGDIAVPATLELVAQAREKLLRATEPFAADEVAAHREMALAVREATVDLKPEERLERRVNHLGEIIAWATAWQKRLDLGKPPVPAEVYEAFEKALMIARRVVNDRDPKASSRMISLTDPDARRGKHEDFFNGFMLDVSVDADSNLICEMDILLASAPEAADAIALIRREEEAHGNNIENLSMDAIGFNGPVLKALEDDPEGPQLTVWTPPIDQAPRNPQLYQPKDFHLNEAGDELSCPQGEKTRTRYRDSKDHAWQYHFRAGQCRDCPLRDKCLTPGNRNGRNVSKNDFPEQYNRARERAKTAAYKNIKKEHPAIERKLNELVRWHDGRRVRYRGLTRVVGQYLLLGVAVNCKRIVRLLTAAPAAQPA